MAQEPQKENLENILSALRDEQRTVREQAIDRLGIYVNSAGSEAENDHLTEAEALKAWDEARTQQLQDSRIAEALLVSIDDPSDRVRCVSALLLGDVLTPEAQESLIRHLLHDPARNVRTVSVMALGHLPYTTRKMEAFIAALQDSEDTVVSGACGDLGRIGNPQAIEPLQNVLSHPSWEVRFKAGEALVRLKAVNLRVVHLLDELNRQPEAHEYNEIMGKANKLNPPEAQALTTQAVLDQARHLLNP
jgi:HEAT repeat protein